ncbi:MAG: hypothetical protein ACLS9K_07390 [Lachnospira eligens]
MTTTLVSMKETIALIRENILTARSWLECGTTPEYAKEIDTDFYAKDAKNLLILLKEFWLKLTY